MTLKLKTHGVETVGYSNNINSADCSIDCSSSKAWSNFANHRVICFNGAKDTHFWNKRDYETISLSEILALTSHPSSKVKEDALAIIPSSYCKFDGRSHSTQKNYGQYVAICGDIDKGNPSLDKVRDAVEDFFGDQIAFLVYSSSGAIQENRKWRVIIPLAQPLTFIQWQDITDAWFSYMDSHGFTMDVSLRRAGQPVFMPNVPHTHRDQNDEPLFFQFAYKDGEGCSADFPRVQEWIAKQAFLRLMEDERRAQAKTPPIRSGATAKGIQDFNAKHTIEALLLEAGYEECPRGQNDWRSPCQSSQSYATRVYTEPDGSQYWVSLSASDAEAGLGKPTGNGHRFGDAFDLYVYFEHKRDFTRALRSLSSNMPALDFSGLSNKTSINIETGEASDVSIANIEEQVPAPPDFLIEEILPASVVTLFSGHGGTSKSTLSLQAAVCLAMGLPFFGKSTQQVKVLVYSAEDSSDIVRWRLLTICQRLAVNPSDLAKNLTIKDASEVDPTLFVEKRDEGVVRGTHTPAMQRLVDDVAKTEARVIIIDNSSDVYGADEIKRVQVREFIRMLATMAKANKAAVLLLAHVDKQAAKGMSNEGYSGSTAWNNSVRSRLFIREESKVLVLEHQKSNYGKRAEPLRLVFDRGFVILEEEAPANSQIAMTQVNAIMELITEFYLRGEWVSAAQTSPNNAYKLLSKEATFPKELSKTDLWSLLRTAERGGHIQKEGYKDLSRHERQRWRVTASTVRQLDG